MAIQQPFLPQAYRLSADTARGPRATTSPRVVYIEATNRCNLKCKTCPRTFLEREPLKTLSLEEFVHIADQFPEMERALLHGIGEPLLNRNLPEMIGYLKNRNVEVLINSNGTLLTPDRAQALVNSGLDAYRCSIDSAERATYQRIRGADLFPKLVQGLEELVSTKARLGIASPRISLWFVATQENIHELPDLVRLAARLGVPEVYVQRMVYFAQEPQEQYGMARADLAIFGRHYERQERMVAECEALGAELGVQFRASGARDPLNSLAAAQSRDFTPWQACLRPWTTAYVTANGNCLPCCISPFATQDYSSLILGRLSEQNFDKVWNDTPYREFRSRLLSADPHHACINCGVHWSL